MATSKDVAKLAGVSHTTVSRAFRGDVKLKPETYDRVMAAANQLHYTPNLLASSLKRKRSQTIGFVLSDISNPFFMGIAQRLEPLLEQDGYRLMLGFDSTQPDKQQRIIQGMAASQAEAIIFTPHLPGERPGCLSNPELGLIQLFKSCDSSLSSFLFDDNWGSRVGMEHLLKQGHRSILVLGGSDRRQGFLDACAGTGVSPKFYEPLLGDQDIALEALKQKIQTEAPTAIFSVADRNSTLAYNAMKELGLSFPRDVSFLVFDDLQWTRMMEISVIAHPLEELAQALYQQLMALVQGDRTPVSTVLQPFLIPRSSVEAPRRM